MVQGLQPLQDKALRAALLLGAAGWKVFPLAQDKRPVSGFGGWEARASSSKAEIEAMFRWAPDAAAVGLPCGPNGLVVIDCDTPSDRKPDRKDGITWFLNWATENHVDVRDAAAVRTPSGGFHLIWRQKNLGLRSCRGSFPADVGVDVKGWGGYVVAVGSPGYSSIPGFGSMLIKTDGPGDVPQAIASMLRGGRAAHPDSEAGEGERLDIETVSRMLDALPNEYGHRDDWVRIGHNVWGATGGSPEGLEAFQAWSSKWPGYDPHATARLWDGINGENVRSGGGGLRRELREAVGPQATARATFPEIEDEGEEAQEIEARAAVARKPLDKWVYVEGLERFLRPGTKQFLTMAGFNAAALEIAPFGGKTSAAKTFHTGGGRHVAAATYAPGKEAVFRDWLGIEEVSFVNLWSPGRIKPWAGIMGPEQVRALAPWNEHLALIFPDEAQRRTFLQWCACCVQWPGRKINWAPLVFGAQGIGKDRLLCPVLKLVGEEENVSEIGVEQIDAPFNGWLAADVIVVTELPPGLGGAKARNRSEKLKNLISTAQKHVMINEKNLKPYKIPNCQKWIFFSNHPDAMAMAADDRRFWVVESPAEKQPPEYYERLSACYEDEAWLSLFMRRLMDVDLAGFNMMTPPPMTAAKAEMIDLSLAPEELFVKELFEDGGIYAGMQFVRIKDALDLARIDGDPETARSITQHTVRKELRRQGYRKLELGKVFIDGHQTAVYFRGAQELANQLTREAVAIRFKKERAERAARLAAEVFSDGDKLLQGD